MAKNKKIRILTNFQIILISTAVYLLFNFLLSNENYYVRKELRQERDSLIGVIDSLKNDITSDSLNLELLKNDDDFLEKYARENFYMHKENEEVFIAE